MNKHTKYYLLVALLVMLSGQNIAWSQIKVLPHYASRALKQSQKNASINRAQFRTQQTTLTLPFFEDFASAQKTDTIWQKNVGVYVNNTLGINAPTVNVASFDGVDGNGVPYDLSSNLAQGGADTLVSCPIDLSSLTAGDNIYLSFAWQAEGLGELPDTDDSLQLQFKDVTGAWVSVWSQMGGDSLLNLGADYTKAFKTEIFPVTDANFLHASFQFRFIAFARISGNYDTWNLDDVFLDRNRNATDLFRNDIALSQAPNSLLKRYNAMPLNQYLANTAGETADNITAKAFNLNAPGSGFALFNYDVILEDTISKTVITTLNDQPIGDFFPAATSKDMTATFDPTLLDPFRNSGGVALKYRFRSFLDITNRNNIDANDTVSRVTVLTDYYAYDDGSAEFLAGVNQNRGQVAYRYVVNEPDSLTDVQMYITRLNKDLSGQTFIFKVWTSKNGKPDSVLTQKILSIANVYAPGINQFVSIKAALEQAQDRFIPLAIQDTVFVGWQQTSDDFLAIGLDKNTDSSKEIYFNLSGEWVQNTDTLGSLMVRPVFGQVDVTGIESPRLDPALVSVYPNPTKAATLHIEGLALYQVKIVSLQGQVVKTIGLDNTRSKKYALDINDLSPGTYLLHCLDKQGRGVAKRVVILK